MQAQDTQHATCPRCGQSKSLDQFAMDRSKARGRKSHCKGCDNARVFAYYREVRGVKLRAAYAERARFCECGQPLAKRQRQCADCLTIRVACTQCQTPLRLDTADKRKRFKQYGKRFCSTGCQADWQRDQAAKARAPLEEARSLIRDNLYRVSGRPKPKPRTFYAGYCELHDAHYTATSARRATCPACVRRHHKDLRRARQRNGVPDGQRAERIIRRTVYERDNWTCQLCKRKVKRDAAVPHPRAPTLDHTTPLARGGTHTIDNVQLACFTCNSRKGARAV